MSKTSFEGERFGEETAVGVDDGEFVHVPWFEGERVDAGDAVGGEGGGGVCGNESGPGDEPGPP